jgi:SH3 domain-containing YSC84-like protein 1
MMRRWVTGSVAVVVVAVSLLGNVSAWADDAQDARQLVEKAKLTAEQFRTDPNMGSLRDYAKKAKGMLILPQMLRAAFSCGSPDGPESGLLRQAGEPDGHPDQGCGEEPAGERVAC